MSTMKLVLMYHNYLFNYLQGKCLKHQTKTNYAIKNSNQDHKTVISASVDELNYQIMILTLIDDSLLLFACATSNAQ